MDVAVYGGRRRQAFVGHLRRALGASYTRRREDYREDEIPLTTNCYMLLNWAVKQGDCCAWRDCPYLKEQSYRGAKLPGVADADIGDWLFVSSRQADDLLKVTHVGVLAKEEQRGFTVIHASEQHGRVVEEPFDIFCQRYRIVLIRRMIF
jgi:hypothetical protein